MRALVTAWKQGDSQDTVRHEVASPEAAGVLIARLLRQGWDYCHTDNLAQLACQVEPVDSFKIGDDQPGQVEGEAAGHVFVAVNTR